MEGVPLVGKAVFETFWARTEGFPFSLPNATWFREPHTPKHEPSIGGEMFCVLMLTLTLGGLESGF